MNIETITLSKAEARRKLGFYRTSLHRKANAEYALAATAYQALANGHPVVDLGAAMRTVAVDAKGRPALAIGRADETQVKLRRSHTGEATYESRFQWRRRSGWATTVAFQLGRAFSGWAEGFALIPLVPPEIRKHHALDRCHVLWQVEAWAERPIGAVADKDPLLLRFLAGTLWMVLGAWDLTEVERAVMAGRAVDA